MHINLCLFRIAIATCLQDWITVFRRHFLAVRFDAAFLNAGSVQAKVNYQRREALLSFAFMHEEITFSF
jgi:hypothetical protein